MNHIQKPVLVIERTLNAPRYLVWKAWTEPDRLAQWWGPKGFEWVHCTLDLKKGGMFHYCMKSPEGYTMWGRFVFGDILQPELLEYVVSFSDEHGGVTRHPLSAQWPLEVFNKMTFTESGGTTVLRIEASPVNASEHEENTFVAAQDMVRQGFAGTMEQLDLYLSSIAKEQE